MSETPIRFDTMSETIKKTPVPKADLALLFAASRLALLLTGLFSTWVMMSGEKSLVELSLGDQLGLDEHFAQLDRHSVPFGASGTTSPWRNRPLFLESYPGMRRHRPRTQITGCFGSKKLCHVTLLSRCSDPKRNKEYDCQD